MAQEKEQPIHRITASTTTATTTTDKENVNENRKEAALDPVLFSCLLQPETPGSDPDYIGIRRILLSRKAEAGCRGRLVTLLDLWFLFSVYGV